MVPAYLQAHGNLQDELRIKFGTFSVFRTDLNPSHEHLYFSILIFSCRMAVLMSLTNMYLCLLMVHLTVVVGIEASFHFCSCLPTYHIGTEAVDGVPINGIPMETPVRSSRRGEETIRSAAQRAKQTKLLDTIYGTLRWIPFLCLQVRLKEFTLA
jgi:hypothetical protein